MLNLTLLRHGLLVQRVGCMVLLIGLSHQSAMARQGTIDKRLSLAIQPTYEVSRSHAPLSLNVALIWRHSALIEGHLELEWFVDTIQLGTFVSPELALADSTITLPVMFPPVMLADDLSVFSIRGRFVTANVTYDLDVHDIALQPDWRRVLLTGICLPRRDISVSPMVELEAQRQQSLLPAELRLERFFENRFLRRELAVTSTNLAPADVPTDPLKMLAFDLFVIPAESLPKLKPRQLDSLRTWTRAGGSLCVFVDRTLPRQHVEWLNRLAGLDLANAAYATGADGAVTSVDDLDGGIARHHTDLGRTVVAFGEPDFDSDAWEQGVLFLWKVRADHRHAALRDRLWKTQEAVLHASFERYVPLEPVRRWAKQPLSRMLLPDSVGGLPVGTVGMVLVLFLLVIAPGDYLVLGWLKRRRWTWIVFPAVSLLFTGYTMWLAQRYLGSNSYQHSITVVDVGQDGRPVRTSKFELLYTHGNLEVAREQEQSLMVPLDPAVEDLMGQASRPLPANSYEQPWTYRGRVPQAYDVLRDVQQWSPRLSRDTKFHSAQDATPVPPQVQELLMSDRTDETAMSTSLDPTQATSSRPFTFVMGGEVQLLTENDGTIPDDVIRLAKQITDQPETGYFGFFSQLSPNGGGNWEDLALLDSTNPQQSVTVTIAAPTEGEFVIYRRPHWNED